MPQNDVHNLVHHHEVHFLVRELFQELLSEVDKLTIRCRRGHILIHHHTHVHQEQPQKAVVAKHLKDGKVVTEFTVADV